MASLLGKGFLRAALLFCAAWLGFLSVASAEDCIGEQANCNSNCILTRRGDMGCINQCGARAQACISRQYGDASGNRNQRSGRSSRDDDDDAEASGDARPANQGYPQSQAEPSYRPEPSPSRYSTAAPARPSSEGGHFDNRDYSHCYETFYDQAMYRWLAIRNKCPQAISVLWRCNACGERLGSSATIQPGAKESTGLSADEVDRKGGLSIAACGEGFRAVGDARGSTWQPNTGYYCMKR